MSIRSEIDRITTEVSVQNGLIGQLTTILRDKAGVEAPKNYTNLLPLATDTDRAAIYNGAGYKTDTRLSSSGSASTQAGMCATGFIPAAAGDVLRVKGIDHVASSNEYIIAYNSSNAKTGYVHINSTQGKDLGIFTESVLTGASFEITLTEALFGSGFNAIRFSCAVMDADTIVTINEEIKEPEPEPVTIAGNTTGLQEAITAAEAIETNVGGVPAGLNIKYLIPCSLVLPRVTDGSAFGFANTFTATLKRENVNQMLNVDWILQDAADNTTAGYWAQHCMITMSPISQYPSTSHIYSWICGAGNAGVMAPQVKQNAFSKSSLSVDVTLSADSWRAAAESANRLGENFKGLLMICDSSYDGAPIVDESKLTSFIVSDYVTAGWEVSE